MVGVLISFEMITRGLCVSYPLLQAILVLKNYVLIVETFVYTYSRTNTHANKYFVSTNSLEASG